MGEATNIYFTCLKVQEVFVKNYLKKKSKKEKQKWRENWRISRADCWRGPADRGRYCWRWRGWPATAFTTPSTRSRGVTDPSFSAGSAEFNPESILRVSIFAFRGFSGPSFTTFARGRGRSLRQREARTCKWLTSLFASFRGLTRHSSHRCTSFLGRISTSVCCLRFATKC